MGVPDRSTAAEAGTAGDPGLGSFRPFRGFQGTIVPLPAKVAARLSGLASPRLVSLGVQEGLADSGQVRVDAAIEGHNAAVRRI